MKTAVIVAIVASLLTGATGFWFGYHIQNPPMTWDSSVMVNCGSGDFRQEAFRVVNYEIRSQIGEFCDKSAHKHCFVAVVPEISGYTIRMIGERGALIQDETHRAELADWIHNRMMQIHGQEFLTQQAGTGQPATSSESDSEGGDKPQPEAEGRSR